MATSTASRPIVSRPATVGACATLACLWEVTAPKPGNVYRGADFEDLTYVDFLTSAAVVGPILDQAADLGVGQMVLRAVEHTRAAVGTNTNLGMLLLMAPLAAVSTSKSLEQSIREVLSSLNQRDATDVFAAIRVASPGGLGTVDEADVNETVSPSISLVEAMRLAAERDLVARQFTNEFTQVFQIANNLERLVNTGLALSDAIVRAFVELLADYPDSLIARKCGEDVASQVSAHATRVLSRGAPGEVDYEAALQEFDFALRVDGHRRNPGTSADLIAAALFVLLREDRLDWPVNFYRREEPQS